MKNPTKTETRPEPATAEERVKALAIQREFVKRIRVELGDRKLLAKHAKACLESALFDLESMTDSSAPGRVYPGVLVIDEETGRPKSYKSLADLAAEEERSKRAEQDERESLFPTKGKAKAEALETVDPDATPGSKHPKRAPASKIAGAFDDLGLGLKVAEKLEDAAADVLGAPRPKRRKKFGFQDIVAHESVDPGTGEVLPRKLKKFGRDRDAEARKGTR